MKNIYSHNFYKERHQKTVYAARTVLPLVLDALPPVHSAIDFGCGVGTWLSVLKEKGVSEIQGVDGAWVKQELLEIPSHNFHQADLEETIFFDKKYDLAISLEVAEHISRENAAGFVDSLINASDFILFSAAIPFQGGGGHINEQWQDYWADMFAKRGCVALDFVRSRIWNDREIPSWYRQNILLFVKEGQAYRLNVPSENECGGNVPISIVHPDVYLSKLSKTKSIKGSWKLFIKALKNHFKKKTGRGS